MTRFCSLLLPLLLVLSGCGQREAEAQIFAMDTVMALTAFGSGAESAVSGAENAIRSLEAMLDRTSDTSEVSALNGGAGGPVAVSATLAELLRAAVELSNVTDGCFDVTIAPVMDAWGFTTDRRQVPAPSVLDALLPLVDSRLITLEDTAKGPAVTLAEGQSVNLGGIVKG